MIQDIGDYMLEPKEDMAWVRANETAQDMSFVELAEFLEDHDVDPEGMPHESMVEMVADFLYEDGY